MASPVMAVHSRRTEAEISSHLATRTSINPVARQAVPARKTPT